MIEFDFGQALKQASNLEDIAQEMKSLAKNRICDALQDISANWKSESATVFIRKSDSVRQDIAQTAEQLYEIAALIRSKAQEIYEADQAAARLAQQRNQ